MCVGVCVYVSVCVCLSVCVCVFDRSIRTVLHYTVTLHVLVYTLLHNNCFPFVFIWMVICLLPTYICAIYTRHSLFSLLQSAEIYRFVCVCVVCVWCLVYCSLLKSIGLCVCVCGVWVCVCVCGCVCVVFSLLQSAEIYSFVCVCVVCVGVVCVCGV